MKKAILSMLVVLTLAGCGSTTAATPSAPAESSVPTVESTATSDAVSSASVTRTALTGDDYTAPESTTIAQVISVSSDGYPSMSTIHAWKVDGDKITVVITEGRTISNLITLGDLGTIVIHGSSYYLLHVETENVKTLEYSDEAYNNGEFNTDYSGADRKAAEYTVTFNINDLEATQVYMFD